MGVTTKIIVVEERLAEIFETLPAYIDDKGNEFKPLFKFGDNKELLAFLKQNEGSKSPYPLIWLVYPYEENHQRTHVQIDNMDLILAVETNSEMFNEERFETTYKDVLFPLYDNIRTLFDQANIISTDDTYRVVKYPNYGNLEGTENETVDIWDALKMTFNCQITNWCFNAPIIF